MSYRDAVNGFGILIALRCVPFIMMTARHFFTAPHFHDVRLAHNIAQHSPARFADSSFQGTFAEDVRGIPKWYSHGSGHQNWDMFLNLGDHICLDMWENIYNFFHILPKWPCFGRSFWNKEKLTYDYDSSAPGTAHLDKVTSHAPTGGREDGNEALTEKWP